MTFLPSKLYKDRCCNFIWTAQGKLNGTQGEYFEKMKHEISHFQAENQFSGAVERKFEKVSQSVTALTLKFNLPLLVYTKKDSGTEVRIGDLLLQVKKSLHL